MYLRTNVIAPESTLPTLSRTGESKPVKNFPILGDEDCAIPKIVNDCDTGHRGN